MKIFNILCLTLSIVTTVACESDKSSRQAPDDLARRPVSDTVPPSPGLSVPVPVTTPSQVTASCPLTIVAETNQGYARNVFMFPANPENNAKLRYLSLDERLKIFEACKQALPVLRELSVGD
jgi:hypothetical protein